MTKITILTKTETTTKEAVLEHNVPETYKNTTPEKHAYFDAEVEAIHMILSGIGDDNYSTVDNEVNDIHVEQLVRNANPLTLVAATL
uniref:Uncharacterized protein n=1 Tax=Tanacetum cinerariifolium TaxID=118510 RepID=A0A699KB76_TANCI|nr:hypothetical protein [Tanacetum cinerariifolium]